jgi:hypothetical protein
MKRRPSSSIAGNKKTRKPHRRVRAVVTYPRDTILDVDQLAAALGIGRRKALQLDLPCFWAGKRPRWYWGQVLDALRDRATEDTAP